MNTSWPRSQEAWERAKRSLGAGVSSGLRAQMKPHPLYFEYGKGAHLRDVDGNDYIDYVLGWGPVILGHAPDGVTAAVVQAAARGATFGAGHLAEYKVAEAVVAAIPGVERLLWTNTGSEATQIALRLARAATGRNRYLKMVGNYHGWTDTFLVGYRPGPDGGLNEPGGLGHSKRSLDEVVLGPFNDLDTAGDILRAPGSDISAVFVEPVACNSGVVPPSKGYLEGLRALCDETRTLLVFDEVITGFRIAYGGAVERYHVRPDLVVLGKAIAGGYPLAAVAGRADLIDQTERGVVHAGTYNGSPVVLAAAAATLEALRAPGTYDGLEAIGRRLAVGLDDALAGHGVKGTVTQVGPVVQCSLGVDGDPSVEKFLVADQEHYDSIAVELLRRGTFVLPGGRWYISTAHSTEDIDQTVEAFGLALDALDDAPDLAAEVSSYG